MNKSGLMSIVLALGMGCGSGAVNQEQASYKLAQLRQTDNAATQADKAVLLIDMQELFFDSLNSSELEEEMPYQIEVLNAAKRNNIPVFVLEYKGYGGTVDELMDVVSTLDYKVITKPEDNGFTSTALDTLLKEKGIHSITLMGIYASACVRATAEGALENGYNILTSTDVIADVSDWEYYGESADWYAENGTLFEDHEMIVTYLDRQNKPR